MPPVTIVAMYFVIWWLVLLIVLPLNIKGQHEDGNVVKGSEPGAPVNPQLKKKVIQTTILAAIIWAIIMVIIKFELVTLDDIPFVPDFGDPYAKD